MKGLSLANDQRVMPLVTQALLIGSYNDSLPPPPPLPPYVCVCQDKSCKHTSSCLLLCIKETNHSAVCYIEQCSELIM